MIVRLSKSEEVFQSSAMMEKEPIEIKSKRQPNVNLRKQKQTDILCKSRFGKTFFSLVTEKIINFRLFISNTHKEKREGEKTFLENILF